MTRISDLVFQVDSIEGLVAKMQANPQDAVLQRHSARSLYDLCVGKDAAAMKRKQQAAEAHRGKFSIRRWEMEVMPLNSWTD